MSFFTIEWSELSLQMMITFAHFLWQACAVGIFFAIAEQLACIFGGRAKAYRLNESSQPTSNEPIPDGLRRSANIRYTLACLAFFFLPLCVVMTFVGVHQSRGPIMLAVGDPIELPSNSIASTDESVLSRADTDISVSALLELPLSAGAELPATKLIESPNLVTTEPAPSQYIQAYSPYLLLAYTIGVALLLTRFCVSIASSSRLRQTLQPIADRNLLEIIAEQASRVGLKRVPIVAICQKISVPVVVGVVKPMILLPSALLCGLDPNQLAAVLSHELAHIRRYDLIVNLLQRIVEAFLFFHPATWWLSRRVSIERENCCDDVAAAYSGRLSYAGALLQMAELCIGNNQRRSAALATLSADGGNSTDFGYRIRRLIGAEETTHIGLTRRRLAVGMAMASLLTISLVAWGQSRNSADDEKLEDEAIFEVTLLRPEIPTLRLELDSGNVPLTVSHPDEKPLAATFLDEAADKSIAWGEPVGGMRLGIRLSEFARRRSPLRHGEHLNYEVWIKNETEELVTIARDPRDLYRPRLMNDRSINVVGGGMIMSFMIPPEALAKAELILPPGQAARRFTMPDHSASIRPPGSPRGRYGSDPLLLEPGKYPVYAQLGELKSGVEEVEIIPAARLQIRKASYVTEKKRENAAQDPSEAILTWQTGDGEKHEVMLNWDHGVLVDEGDLASVEIVPVDGQPDRYSILLHLRPESATWLARQIKSYTLWDDPDMVAMLLDGKPLSAVRLDASTPVSKIMISGGFTQKEVGDVASRIRSSKNSNWITAPQVCVGKAYSDSAKAANWQQDHEQRASLATPNSGEMLASVLPGENADFVTWTRLRLAEGSLCRLTVGDGIYDISKTGERTRLVTAGKEYTFDNDAKFPEGSTLSVKRRDNKMTVQVNEQSELDLGSNARAIEKISLQSTRGTIAVSHFVVTGNVQRVNQPQFAPNNAGLQIRKAFLQIKNSGSQRLGPVDSETGNPAQGQSQKLIPVVGLVAVRDGATIKAVAEKLIAARSLHEWKLEHVDDGPSVKVDGFQAYRIVLRRTWKEFTILPQSAAIGVDQGPFESRSEDWEFMLIPKGTKKIPTDLRTKIPWQKSNSPYQTRDVCLGEGLNYLWFTRGTIFGQEFVRVSLQLQGGDDRIQLLVDGIQVDDTGTNTANTCRNQIEQFGDRALPYIRKAVESSQTSEKQVRVVGSLGMIKTDQSTELLLKYYDSSNPQIQRGAQYALIHRPFRKAAKRAYLDMLTRHSSVDSACAACIENKWTEAVPILKQIESQPQSLGELQIVYPVRRTLEGNPIPEALLEASQVIFQSRPSDPVDDGSVIGNAVKLLKESSDHQAVIVLALKMANYGAKASHEHIQAIRAHGTAILKSQKSAEAVFFLARLLDSLPPREREQILQDINPLKSSNPASSLTPPLTPYQTVPFQPAPAARPVPTGSRKLVATIFGTTVYLDQLEPSERELSKIPQDQAAAKKLDFEGEALLRMISRRAIEDYVRREKIEITPEMSSKLFEIVKTKELPANPDSTMSDDNRRAGLLFMMRGSLMDWLVCKSLYEKYGGRVGMGSLGLWIAVDGRNELMREYLKKGSIVISDAALEKAFWKAANKPNFADDYPKGDQLKHLMSNPPFFTEPLSDSR